MGVCKAPALIVIFLSMTWHALIDGQNANEQLGCCLSQWRQRQIDSNISHKWSLIRCHDVSSDAAVYVCCRWMLNWSHSCSMSPLFLSCWLPSDHVVCMTFILTGIKFLTFLSVRLSVYLSHSWVPLFITFFERKLPAGYDRYHNSPTFNSKRL